MLTPSYSELMEIVNEDLEDSKVTSRYTIVLAVAKRARQIINGAEPLTHTATDRAVSIAVKELAENRVKINSLPDAFDDNYERILQSKQKTLTAVTRDDLREDLKQDYEPEIYSVDEEDEKVTFKSDLNELEEGFLYDDEMSQESDLNAPGFGEETASQEASEAGMDSEFDSEMDSETDSDSEIDSESADFETDSDSNSADSEEHAA